MSEKSALRLIPGEDALLQWLPQPYEPNKYVEYQGLIYKSKITTSSTFVSTEWELIADLREVRVKNIKDRNALTGVTATTGTTGIRIPILDNTNVLVLNAAGDPQVGSPQFARYNYNQTTASWLLLQIGTGATSGTSIGDYSTLTNKPAIISGITANAGAGLTGGGIFNGAVPPNRATFSFAHADTSSQANITPTGRTYIQQLRFDTFGHVTGGTTSLWTHPDTSGQASINNTGYTYIQDITIDGDGHVTALGSSTWVHPDTSSQGNVTNTGNTVIQSISVDGSGHITNIASTTIVGGGSFSGFNVAGNSGNFAMPNGGSLNITGTTNVQTVASLIGSNLGLKIDVLPVGSNGELQMNNAGALAGTPSMTYFNSRLTTPNLNISTQPATGSTSLRFLQLNSTGGTRVFAFNAVEAALASLPVGAIQYRDATGFAGINTFKFNGSINAMNLGTRGTGTSGSTSLVIGTANIASGTSSVAIGNSTQAGLNALAGGLGSVASGDHSFAYGQAAYAVGSRSVAINNQTRAQGVASFAGGFANASNTNPVTAGGVSSFNFSENTTNPVSHGAHGRSSAILGGRDHNIEVGNDRAVILGGNAIKLTGTTYVDYVAVPNLAIMTQPSTGIATDEILVRNLTTGRIRKITQNSLPAGTTGSVQIRAASGYFGSSTGLVFLTGTSTLNTANLNITSIPVSGTSSQILSRNTITGAVERISANAIAAPPTNAIQYRTATGFGGHAEWLFDPTNRALTLGSRVVSTVGVNSIGIGSSTTASGTSAIAIGGFTVSCGASIAIGTVAHANIFSIAVGNLAKARGVNSAAFNSNTTASGTSSMAIGQVTHAAGTASFAGGWGSSGGASIVRALGDASFNFSLNTVSSGVAANAPECAILGGRNHNIAVGNTRAAIIGGSGIDLTGTSYVDHTAVPNLVIYNTPITGLVSDDILVRNPTNKKIRSVTQDSLSHIGLKHANIAYVSKSGNNATAVIGNILRPYLTINAAFAAINTAAIATSTNRCLVYVDSGLYSENIDASSFAGSILPSFIDIYLSNARMSNLTLINGSTDMRIYGNGFINIVQVQSTMTGCELSIECNELNSMQLLNVPTANVNITCDMLRSDVAWTSGHMVINARRIYGRITPNGSGTNAVCHINAELISGGTGNFAPIYCVASGTDNSVLYVNARRIINGKNGTGGDSTVEIQNGFAGKVFITADEIIARSQTVSPIRAFGNQTGLRVNIDAKRIVSLSSGNVAAVDSNFSAGIIAFKSGTQLIPSGTANSIVGFGDVVALGDIYGKNANAGTITIQVGTFTNNSTYIIN